MPDNITKIKIDNCQEPKHHIVMLSRALPFHNIGGMEILAWDLALQLISQGYKVTIITTRIPDRPERFIIDDIEVIALQKAVPKRYSVLWWKESKEYVRKTLMESSPVILSVSAAAFGLLSLKRDFHNVPFIFQAHGTSIGEIISKWRTRRFFPMLSSLRNVSGLIKSLLLFPKFDAFVAVGESVMRDLNKPPISWVLPQNKVFLIQNGINTTFFSPNQLVRSEMRTKYGWDAKHTVVVSASRLHAQKGLDLGLYGFAKYAEKNNFARYVIIGDGSERSNLMNLADSLKISDKVVFAGMVSRSDMPDYLRMGDVFLFTTKWREGLPLNVLEALAIGMPVIISRHMAEIFQSVPAVYPINPLDDNEIAEVIGMTAKSANYLNSLLPEEFSLKYCAEKYCQLFDILKA